MNEKMIKLSETSYTKREATELACNIHDVLWDAGIRGWDVDLKKVAIISSLFATTEEEWEKGRKDLKELGTFIGLATLEVMNKKGYNEI